ncbi:MAG: DUF1624 domain-containing protein [Curvibacter sp.]|nr:DUF1624 domain-containing protein [Curvibacter sp.]
MNSRPRFDTIDALRGLAIVWMTGFHFCFDLSDLKYWSQNFYADPFWTVQRSCIVSLFLLCAGLGQAVAQSQGLGWPRFLRRWGQVAACAALVTAGSWWVFPHSFIYFGVLHGMALMLLLLRRAGRLGIGLWPLGAAAIGLKFLAPGLHQMWPALEVFNGPALNWIGLVDRLPVTEDYVPLLPWLGVMCWGLAAGQWLLAHRPQWVSHPLPVACRPLCWLGRHSLSWYMLHQLVMFGALSGLRALGF